MDTLSEQANVEGCGGGGAVFPYSFLAHVFLGTEIFRCHK